MIKKSSVFIIIFVLIFTSVNLYAIEISFDEVVENADKEIYELTGIPTYYSSIKDELKPSIYEKYSVF